MMVVLGCDAHKRTHTVVAVDAVGAQLDSITVAATRDGHLRLVRWAAQFGERRWAIEDCRHVSRRLEGDLLVAGELVVRVPPKLMAAERRTGRTWGKSDPIDALATARAALREPDLPVAQLDGPSREVRLLVDHREQLIKERTAAINRLRWHLHELEPGYDPASLTTYVALNEVRKRLGNHTGMVAELAGRYVDRIEDITREAKQLETEIDKRIAELAPTLLTIPGCGPLTAAKLVGEAADITRFRSRDAYARWSGTAPIPAQSGINDGHHRLNRGGNRQTNAALHRIAITQARIHPAAQQLIARHLSNGKTKREALRSLKRRLSDVVYRTLTNDHQQRHHSNQPQAA